MFAFLLAVGILIPSALGQFPCPNAIDILPCHCTADGEDIDMDCSNINVVDQIEHAFMADMPFTAFRKLTIARDLDQNAVPIESLGDRVFGDATFREVVISNSYLSDIGNNVFEKSFSTLESLTLSHGLLNRYNFATLNLFNQLTHLDMSHNRLSFVSDIISNSLQLIDLSWNGGFFYSPELLVGAPGLTHIYLQNIDMHDLTPLMFAAQGHLDTLDLAGNFVHMMPSDGLWFPNDTVTNVVLDNNFVLDLSIEFIFGTSNKLSLSMRNNSLSDFTAEIWQPVLEKVSGNTKSRIVLGETNIQCGCNIAWLVTSTKYMRVFDSTNQCADGSLFSDLDPDNFAHCP